MQNLRIKSQGTLWQNTPVTTFKTWFCILQQTETIRAKTANMTILWQPNSKSRCRKIRKWNVEEQRRKTWAFPALADLLLLAQSMNGPVLALRGLEQHRKLMSKTRKKGDTFCMGLKAASQTETACDTPRSQWLWTVLTAAVLQCLRRVKVNRQLGS